MGYGPAHTPLYLLRLLFIQECNNASTVAQPCSFHIITEWWRQGCKHGLRVCQSCVRGCLYGLRSVCVSLGGVCCKEETLYFVAVCWICRLLSASENCLESCQMHLKSAVNTKHFYVLYCSKKANSPLQMTTPPPRCGPQLGAQRCTCVCEIKVVPICEAVFLEKRPVRCGNTPQISLTLWCIHCSTILLQSCTQERAGMVMVVVGGRPEIWPSVTSDLWAFVLTRFHSIKSKTGGI